MAADRRALLAASAAVVAVALTACSGAAEPAASSTQPTPSASSSSAAPSPSETAPSASPTEPSSSASPSGFDRTATPATSAGPLSGAALPDPEVLGIGWVARIDPGSAEDGYTGNGTPVVERDPADLAQALLPIGCADASVYDARLPIAAHALEVDYAHRGSGAHGVALALDFGSAQTAQRFVAAYTGALRRCTAGPGGSMVVTVAAAPAGSFASVQQDSAFGTTWRELVTRTGTVVRMVAVEGADTPARPWSSVVAALPSL